MAVIHTIHYIYLQMSSPLHWPDFSKVLNILLLKKFTMELNRKTKFFCHWNGAVQEPFSLMPDFTRINDLAVDLVDIHICQNIMKLGQSFENLQQGCPLKAAKVEGWKYKTKMLVTKIENSSSYSAAKQK